jgi:hypothetical protein
MESQAGTLSVRIVFIADRIGSRPTERMAARGRSMNGLRPSAPTSRGDTFWPTASASRPVGSQREFTGKPR